MIQSGAPCVVNCFILLRPTRVPNPPPRRFRVAIILIGEGPGKRFVVPGLDVHELNPIRHAFIAQRLVQAIRERRGQGVDLEVEDFEISITSEPVACVELKMGRMVEEVLSERLRVAEEAAKIRRDLPTLVGITAKKMNVTDHLLVCRHCKWRAKASGAKVETPQIAISNILTHRLISEAMNLRVS
jgi:hypothetical protein